MTDPTQKSRTQFNKLQKRLRHYVGDAIADYGVLVGWQGFLHFVGHFA
jgi:tRNA 2-thiocytidine biosynthesis protein TtcA